MSQPYIDYDVIVVGAGPSGLTTGISAARSGARVLLVEQHSGLSIFPKATGIRGRTMEIMRSWGLEEMVRSGGMRLPTRMAISETLSQQPQHVTLGVPPPELGRAVSPSDLVIAPQDYLEPILLDHFHEVGGESRFRTALVSLAMEDDLVRVELRPPGSVDNYQVASRYLVGADGPRSLVRQQLGIELESFGIESSHLTALFTADLARRIHPGFSVLNLVTKPSVEGLFVPAGVDRWVYDIELNSDNPQAEAAEWTPERLIQRIRAAAGVPRLAVDLQRTFEWDFAAAVAARYRSGRAFLVGDAAHRTTPRGATGMNTGIADGHNLGWKLAWVVRGWADEALLDSYQGERGPVGRRNAARSMETGIGSSPQSTLGADFGVSYASAVIADGRTGELPFDDLNQRARSGQRAPHAWVDVQGRRLSTIDLFDGKLTLLISAAGSVWRTAADTLPAGPPLQVLVIGTELSDPTGALTERYGLAGGGAVLVRPDGYVAWNAEAAESNADDTLRRAVAQSVGEPVRRAAELVRVA